ncbi:MAG: hypothetical protein OEL76_01365 [Siculibacillus sp.]|nr:hypothetical protein [Siculibacillus sp.]
MSSVLVVHILAAGLWLGCLATEILFEKAMAADAAVRGFVSELHDRVDRFVEGPAFVSTFASGAWLALDAVWTAALVAKVAAGLAAVGLNVWCLKIVLERADAARAGRWDEWERIDRRQHVVGTAVTLLSIAAAGLALARVV